MLLNEVIGAIIHDGDFNLESDFKVKMYVMSYDLCNVAINGCVFSITEFLSLLEEKKKYNIDLYNKIFVDNVEYLI